jgi:hypothetical protein
MASISSSENSKSSPTANRPGETRVSGEEARPGRYRVDANKTSNRDARTRDLDFLARFDGDCRARTRAGRDQLSDLNAHGAQPQRDVAAVDRPTRRAISDAA